MQIIKDDGRLVNNLREDFVNIDIKVSEGKELIISKTNIKRVFPITYTINSKIEILYYLTDEVKKRRYYIPNIKKEFNFPELKNYLKGVL